MAKPTTKSKVSEIKEYLDEKGIHYDSGALKNELLKLAGVDVEG